MKDLEASFASGRADGEMDGEGDDPEAFDSESETAAIGDGGRMADDWDCPGGRRLDGAGQSGACGAEVGSAGGDP